MGPLADQECIPCQGGQPTLDSNQANQFLSELDDAWEVVDVHHLRREFRFPNFRTALAFTNRVGEFAESTNHHPDIELAWGKVVLSIWTHKINGLHQADFIWAAKVDRIFNELELP